MRKKTLLTLGSVLCCLSFIGNVEVRGQVESAPPKIETRKIVGTDDREKVTDTTAAPYSSIAYVQIYTAKSSYSKGTAFVAGENTLVTAAHVAINFINNPEYQSKAFVAPGRDGTVYPFGTFSIESVTINPNFDPNKNNRDSDIAIIKVNPNDKGQTIGSVVPKLPIINASQSSKQATVIGYSGDKPKEQWYHQGKVLEEKSLINYYDTDTMGGNSGSPVINENNEIIAVHVAGQTLSSGEVRNAGTRITGFNYEFVRSHLK